MEDDKARERHHAVDLLFSVLTRNCILPPLIKHDQALNGKAKCGDLHSKAIEAVEARVILCGAAMDALVTAAEGDKSILASTGAHKLLVSPFKFLNINPTGKPGRLAKLILDGSDASVPNFIQLLTTHFSSNKTVLRLLTDHAEIIRQQVFGRNPFTVSNPNPKQPRRTEATITTALQTSKPTSISSLLPSGHSLSLLSIASILREACNQYRSGLPHADPNLGTLLCGNSLTKSRRFLPEQMDPIRGSNAYTRLLLEHIPPAKLTSREGISALLAYMGTGQCSGTKGFLDKNPGIFWDYQRCVTAFNDAKSANDFIYEGKRTTKKAKGKGKRVKVFVDGMTRYDYMQIWGEPCNHLSVGGGITERFQPIFNQKIQERWETWLGPLAGKDPAEPEAAEKCGWMDALNFVTDLGIKGFGRGLTSLQFANNLWVAGIVAEPPIADMVRWLHVNKNLGATRGLGHLGFTINTFTDLYAAFSAVHDHLDEYLSTGDKKILHFGVIFVEHVLCKVSRWGNHLPSRGDLNSKVGGGEWSQGANETNHLAFPIPAAATTSCLEEAVSKANVGLLQQLHAPTDYLIAFPSKFDATSIEQFGAVRQKRKFPS